MAGCLTGWRNRNTGLPPHRCVAFPIRMDGWMGFTDSGRRPMDGLVWMGRKQTRARVVHKPKSTHRRTNTVSGAGTYRFTCCWPVVVGLGFEWIQLRWKAVREIYVYIFFRNQGWIFVR